jgi:hypothetical protein
MTVTRIASALIALPIAVAAVLFGQWILRPGSPYPPSTTIAAIEWAPESQIIRLAPGSDNWPLTWADDDRLYTAYGDGAGFSGRGDRRDSGRLSLGIAVVDGPASEPSGINISAPTAEQTGSGSKGKKASGMLFVGSTLYMWARNANAQGEGCQLAWSADYGKTWEWAAWTFEQLGYCAFANFGKANSWSLDDFAYVYSPDGPSAYREADGIVLLRVPIDEIPNRDEYRFFAGQDADGQAQWSSKFDDRRAVFAFPGGVNRLDVTYNKPLKRFLLTMRNKARGGGRDHFGLFDAPNPWGPWSTVYFVGGFTAVTHFVGGEPGEWGESQHIPSKWISDDGLTINVVFSGGDTFSVRRANLTLR